MRRRAAITDAELNRVLRVARKHGAASVNVNAGEWQATIILSVGENSGEKTMAKIAKREPIRLG